MKHKGHGKKEFVVIITKDDGTRSVVSQPVTAGQATTLVLGSPLRLTYVAIRHLEELGIAS